MLDRSTGERDRLRASVEQRSGSLVRRFHQLADVLVRRGHLVGQPPTVSGRGRVLAGIYADVDLLVAELLLSGLLDGLGPSDLAGVAALLVHESRRDELAPPDHLPSTRLDALAEEIERLAQDIRVDEEEVGIVPLRALDAGFVAPVVRWSQGATLEEAVGDLEVSGGDFVRNIKQVIDLLGQLRDVSDGTRRDALDGALRGLRRGIVDA